MATYKSSHTGGQVDTAVNQVLNNNVKTQWGNVIGTLANQSDLNTALAAKEVLANKVTSLSSASTDTQYPSAKLVYDKLEGKADLDLANISSDGKSALDWKYRKSIAQEYKLYDEAEGYELLEEQKRSTFDKSKFTVVGSPTITDNGIASGFDYDKYVYLTNSFDVSNANSWSVDFSFVIGTQHTSETYLLNFGSSTTAFDQYIAFTVETSNKLKLRLRKGEETAPQEYLDGSHTLIAGVKYNCKIEFTGTAYNVYYKSSTENTWIKSVTVESSEKISIPLYLIIGIASNQTWAGTYSWLDGSIDLKELYYAIDGIEVFNGNKTGIDQIKKNDYTKVGDVVVSDDGIASGFSSSNYLTGNNIDTTSLTSLRIKCSFTTGDSISTDYTTLWNINNALGLFFVYFKSYMMLFYQESGVSYGFQVEPNTSYDTIINWEKGVGIICYYKKQNESVYSATSLNTTINSLTVDTNDIIKIGYGNYLQPFTGSIDLNAFKIFVDGNLVYQPTLRIPYTQSKTGSKIVDETYRDRVEDMYNQYGYTPYYTLGTEPEKYYVTAVGSPTLSGGVASGFSATSYLKTTNSITISKKTDVKIYARVNSKELYENNFIWSMGGYKSTPCLNLQKNNVQLFCGYEEENKIEYNINIQDNANYDFMAHFDKGSISLYYKIESQPDYTLCGTGTLKDDTEYTDTLEIGGNITSPSYLYYRGSIDLSQFSITVDGEEVFHGYDAPVEDAYTLDTVKPQYAPAILYPSRSAGFKTPQFLVANKQTLTVKGKTSIWLNNGQYMTFLNDQSFTIISLLDTGSSLTAGKDYYVYATTDQKLVVSLDATAPSGYTTYTATKIGGFHTICRTVTSSNAPVLVTTSGYTSFWSTHPAIGYTAGDAIPISTWTIAHRPYSSPAGMVYVSGDYGEEPFWGDIYLQSGTGSSTASAFGGTITNNRNPIAHQFDMNHVGKKLMTDSQFTIFAEGSNNKTNISGSAQPSPFTAGGHVDTASQAMISGFFGEECCGLVWQWLDEIAPTGGSAWNAYANTERGQSYGMPYVLRAGGNWYRSTNCGSWSRSSPSTRSNVDADYGARGASRCLPWNYFD